MGEGCAGVVRIREITDEDLAVITVLNNAAVPAVPLSSEAALRQLRAQCHFALCAVDSTGVVGFVMGLCPGSSYVSENYRYFEERGVDHLYVDRIVVAEAARGMRVGKRLYQRVFDLAIAEGRTEVTCEVNLDPPNPGSLAFHQRLGFSQVGTQATKGGSVTVSLMARPIG